MKLQYSSVTNATLYVSAPRMAINVNMNFIKPAFGGDELVAEAKVEGGGRIKFCLLRVYRDDDLIAEGTAIAYGVKKIEGVLS
ncbi:PaaI family thioesterase [Archaeoglobus sp.]